MTYPRIISRHHATGDYARDPAHDEGSFLAGDLRRLEADTRDGAHLTMYARVAGVSTEQAQRLFDAFFTGQFDWSRWREADDPYGAMKLANEALQTRIHELENQLQTVHTGVRMAVGGYGADYVPAQLDTWMHDADRRTSHPILAPHWEETEATG